MVFQSVLQPPDYMSLFPNHVGNAFNATQNCAALFHSSKGLMPGIEPYVARTYPSGSTFTEGDTAVPNLAEFCRFGAEYNTSSSTRIQFELWLPTTEKWNGRFAHVGNGGFLGSVIHADMGVPLSKYGFAVAGTNTGHNGTVLDGTFAISNPESQFDFGYRSVHLSTVFSKKIVEEYYRQKPSYNYWMGCSTGGRQGMKEIQDFPEDYDGIAIEAPAQWWSPLLGFIVRIANLNSATTTSGRVIPPSFFPTWAKEVMAQCDELDGIKDSLIANPQACTPNARALVCGSPNPSPFVDDSTCITDDQAVTLEAVYQNWTSINGDWIFPSFEPGSEADWGVMMGDSPFQLAPDFFLYQVYNHTSVQSPLKVDEVELERIVAIGEATDPGRTSAVNPNLAPFFERGGKVLEYHGFSDAFIPPGSSVHYFEKVRSYFNGADLRDKYRLFLVPGMAHCNGGTGADNFGRPSQRDDSLGGNGQSLVSDPEHDGVLALMEWVEKGKAPDSIVAARYVAENRTKGVAYTRLLCPYPQEGKYIGGDTKKSASFRCE